MYYVELWCVFLLTLGPFVQVRGRHISNEKSVKLDENKNTLNALLEKVEETITDTIFNKETNLQNKIEENVKLLKNLPQICSLPGQQQTETIKRKSGQYFDPCYNLTTQLHTLKELLHDGIDIMYELSIDSGYLIGKLTRCASESAFEQLGCFLKAMTDLEQYIQDLGPKSKEWVKKLTVTSGVVYKDLYQCFWQHDKIEQQLKEISKAALTCSANTKFLQ